VVAVGVPSDVGEDEVKVAVKLRDRAHLDPLEFATWAEELLPYYLVPRYVEFLDEIPKTPNLKPQRHLIQAQGAGGAIDLRALGYKPKRPY
jgi:crotonobetaine/carnitine-CoA ligase